ncbi:unnamed protein product [Pieris brassicae]|uniref:Uncharacterized protein n=1 Tax=Pieris brassicae TaxID=7116 RepID=A0A9P0SF25_PIEBR|nr:unnamed protein product [Pieris brassicae]
MPRAQRKQEQACSYGSYNANMSIEPTVHVVYPAGCGGIGERGGSWPGPELMRQLSEFSAIHPSVAALRRKYTTVSAQVFRNQADLPTKERVFITTVGAPEYVKWLVVCQEPL